MMLAQPRLDVRHWLQLGSGYELKFLVWAPDIALNVKWVHLSYLIRLHPIVGAIIRHQSKDCENGWCEGAVHFVTDLTDAGPFKNNPRWSVLQWEPLTLDAPIQCQHEFGYVRQGRWMR